MVTNYLDNSFIKLWCIFFLLHCNKEFINEGKQKDLSIYLEIGVICLLKCEIHWSNHTEMPHVSFSQFDTITALTNVE